MIPNRIVSRLLLGFLLLSPLPLAGLAWLYLQAFERTLNDTVLVGLSSIADKKADQINSYLDERLTNSLLLARSVVTAETLAQLSALHGRVQGQSADYQAISAHYQYYVQTLFDNVGYYDLLLTDGGGNVVFSVLQEADLGTNLLTGPYRGSTLAQAHREAMALLDTQVTLAQPYAPSAQRPAIFIVTPVIQEGRLLGTVALQVDLEKLTRVTSDNTGLGQTGKTILAQSEGDMARYAGTLWQAPDAAFRHVVPVAKSAAPMQLALVGGHGRGVTRDDDGVEIIAAWRYLPALRWGMVVKMDTAEAFAPASRLQHFSLLALGVLLLAAGGGAVFLGRVLVLPIRALMRATRRIAAGDLQHRAPVVGCDEFRQLAESFNQMGAQIQVEQGTLERRVAERTAALAESENTLRRAQAVAKVGSWHLDLADVGLTWSEETYRIFGVPQGHPLSYEDFLACIHPDDNASVDAAWQAALKGDPYDITHRIIVGGEVRWVREQAELVFDGEGQLCAGIGTVQDITNLKAAEEQLTRVLKGSNEGWWDWDLEANCLFYSPRWWSMLGYVAGECQGDPELWLSLLHPDDLAATQAAFARYLSDGTENYTLEFRLRHKNGHYVPLLSRGFIQRDAGGKAVRVSGTNMNLSDRKAAEAALQEAKQAAEVANQAKSEFLANMSHEIRTPMNAILGLTQLVLDSDLNPQQDEFLRKVHTASRALLGILNDILDYSKIEAGRLEVEQMPLGVEDVLKEVAGLFGVQIEAKGLELFLELAPEVPMQVCGDSLRLTQVLNNLVGNAAKFTERGEIHVRVEVAHRDDTHLILRFAVRDTGIGLSRLQAERLFQAFTQADGSITRKYGGTGLGLAICQKLVGLMGGDIAVSSIEGQGATFSFTVQVGVVLPSGQMEKDLQVLGRLKTLVVDDQETSRLILSRLLGAWGLEVQTADSGEVALAALVDAQEQGCPFEVLLLDWRMPGMSGLEAARQLELAISQGRLRNVLMVFMVSAYDRAALLAQAGSIPLHGVLSKPVTPSALFAALVPNLEATRRTLRLDPANGLPLVAMTAAVMQDDRERCSAALGLPPDGPGMLDRAAVTQLLARLGPYLEQGELVPDPLLGDLLALARYYPTWIPLARLLHHIDLFDHRGALACIDQIATLLEQTS